MDKHKADKINSKDVFSPRGAYLMEGNLLGSSSSH